MTEDKIKDSLVRYINNAASASDLDSLDDWVRDEKNYLVFKEYVKTHFAITIGMNNPDPSNLRDLLLNEIRKDKNVFRKRRFNKFLKYAAVGLFLIGVGYFFKQESAILGNEDIVIQKNDEITLELENGEKVIISEDGASKITNANGKIIGEQEGAKLVYNDGLSASELSYNTLKIPYGKRFNIVLSDGTRVFMNAGSSIKYPTKFIKGLDRKVFLEGEAFFEVSHDKEHSFIVDAQDLKVRVYGTKFNLSNYPEDNNTQVVLTDGSVGLSYKSAKAEDSNDTVLTPGFMGSFDKEKKTISTSKVNTSLYTSWVEGNLVFKGALFEKIIESLERQYNVVIINNNKELADEKFNATIETNREPIEKVLDYFDRVYDIEYEVVNNKIIIN